METREVARGFLVLFALSPLLQVACSATGPPLRSGGVAPPIDAGVASTVIALPADPTPAIAPSPVVYPSGPLPITAMAGVPISKIVFETRDVFEDQEHLRWLFDTIEFLHATTRERVIRRELLLRPGDVYDPALAEETERNLRRRLDFISDARVWPEALEDGTVALHVETKDRFTLRAGASGGVFSGASTRRISIGESNLFGTGKQFRVRYRETDEEEDLSVSYKDPQFLATYKTLRVSASESDDGGGFAISLEEPFRALSTELGYRIGFQHDRSEQRYHEFGDEITQIPERQTGVEFELARATGPRNERTKYGFRTSYRKLRYGVAEGDQPNRFRVPDDVRIFEIGPTLTYQYLPFFEKRTYLDAMGITEDVPLGFIASAFLGLQHRVESSGPSKNQPVVSLSLQWAGEPGPDQLMTLVSSGASRFRGSSVRGWNARAAVHYYYFGLPMQTLAASLTFDAEAEKEGFEPQLSLGEDNGLRGYNVRFFTGDRRVRLNLEDRIFPDWELISVRFGAVVFFDAGLVWTNGQPVGLDDIYKSAGIGLRIGSPELVRRNVARIDLAFPLDDHPEEDFSVSVSASVGQIFDLFGNAEGIDRDF